MTDGLEAARRSEVAESFRYARAFYDEAEAGGPAEFERNRQAIIDVIALAYRDGSASARAGESALRAVAQEIWSHRFDEVSMPPDIAASLKAALDGAPWEPSEEQVERAAEAGWRAIDTDDDWALIEEKNRAPWRIFARAALKAASLGSAHSVQK